MDAALAQAEDGLKSSAADSEAGNRKAMRNGKDSTDPSHQHMALSCREQS